MGKLDQLKGRAAVVTGAGSGIGEAFAQHAAELGLRVLAIDVSAQRLVELEGWAASRGYELRTSVTDVRSFEAMEHAAEIIADWGPVGVLVNNAGVEFTGRLWETEPADWERLQAINVNGVFNGIRAFLPSMIASGKPGHVVCTSSIGGFSTAGGMAGYICSKTSVRLMAQCLRDELGEAGSIVGVTSVHPGAVKTNIFNDAPASGDTGSDMRDQMRQYLDATGVEPAEVARLTFQAVDNNEFWVHTHPGDSQNAIDNQNADLASGLQAVG